MTKQDFIQAVRNKYPEYKTKGDEDLYNAFIKKYPVYESQIDKPSPTQVAPAEEKKDGFLKSVGKEIITSIPRALSTPLAMLSEGVRGLTGTEQSGTEKKLSDFAFRGTELGTKERAGSAAMSALDIGTAVIPVSKVGQGVSKGMALAKNTGKGALIGGGYGASSGLLNNTDPKKSALYGSLFGAALPLVMPVLKGVQDKLRGASDRLYSNAIGEGKKEILKNTSRVSTEMSKKGIFGSKDKILTTAEDLLTSSEDELQDILLKDSSNGIVVDMKNIATKLDPLIEQYKKVAGEKRSVEVLQELRDQIVSQGKVDISEANKIKRALYQVLDSQYGKDLMESPVKKAGQKLLAKGLKESIETNSSSKSVQSINKDLQTYGRAIKMLRSKIAGEESKNIIGIGDLATTIAGSLAVGDITGGLVTTGARKVLGSSTTKTGTSVLLRKLSEIGSKTPVSEQLINAVKLYAPKNFQTPLIEVLKKLPEEIRYIYFQAIKNDLGKMN